MFINLTHSLYLYSTGATAYCILRRENFVHTMFRITLPHLSFIIYFLSFIIFFIPHSSFPQPHLSLINVLVLAVLYGEPDGAVRFNGVSCPMTSKVKRLNELDRIPPRVDLFLFSFVCVVNIVSAKRIQFSRFYLDGNDSLSQDWTLLGSCESMFWMMTNSASFLLFTGESRFCVHCYSLTRWFMVNQIFV